jgi:hypothetical protein
LVFDFDFGGRIPPLKPLCFEGGIDMRGCHLLKFFYSHICDGEAGIVTFNLEKWNVSKTIEEAEIE